MAKTLIYNTLGATTKSFSVPADDTSASAFCSAMLDGEYEGFVKKSESGTDTGITGYHDVRVQVSNDTGSKTYFGFLAKIGVTDVEIQNALIGKTFNGVKADKLFVQMREVKVGA
ncbi:hypothetical protein [Sulfurospirillum barnesii]|uniref:Uncharacterized protein n=1 Tax=Sulfurospirillum barnesii (strain ATCC 700032 / DSM 10660 / SES-3) TaxID=760154 RepID=I3Y0M7_SULBS|nr:hypothetical protein [Sulfurospirillum barnesii]AFL69751.1 hypothetical protein Sulba_2484 [Sulfurospirillum barnesii SES-3]